MTKPTNKPSALVMKRCGKCEKLLPLDRFHVNPTGLHSRYSSCKRCCHAYYTTKVRREKNIVASRAWAAAHPALKRAISLASYHRCKARNALTKSKGAPDDRTN